jgi:hypothetical protein
VLVFNRAPRHEGVLVLHALFDLGTRWTDRFNPREKVPSTHWTGSWVGPRAVLDTMVKRKIPSYRRELNPRTPIVQPVDQRYTD